MFPWWVRLFIFLPLAALQIILITIKLMGWQYEIGFEQFMLWLGDLVVSALQLDLIEALIRSALAGRNVFLPELGKHWHHVFVLLWLFMGSFARVVGRELSPLAATGVFLLAGLCSFAPAFAAGAMPVGSVVIAIWPIGGFFAFTAILLLLHAEDGVSMSVLLAACAATFIALGYFIPEYAAYAVAGILALWAINGLLRRRRWDIALVFTALATAFVALDYFVYASGENAVLLWLAALVGFVGVGFLAFGLFFGEGRLSDRAQEPLATLGLDIISPFAAAATAAWAFGKYIPI
jgi:hypothetical protein